jgi:hypothetical protein
MTMVWSPDYLGSPGKMVLAKDYPADADVKAYVAAVEAADELDTPGIGALEPAVIAAYDNFIVGCKADGIWNAIKASCILAGARTLAGALQPLVGTAPTNNNFVSGDYDRKTGLKGTASSNKNLLTNYTVLASNVNNTHYSIFPTESISFNAELIGGSAASVANGLSGIYVVSDTLNYFSCWNSNNYLGPIVRVNKLAGGSRNTSGSFTARGNGTSQTITQAAIGSPQNHGMRVFTRDRNGVAQSYSTGARIAFYSIGSNLDLALLDARVSTLISDLGAAIP